MHDDGGLRRSRSRAVAESGVTSVAGKACAEAGAKGVAVPPERVCRCQSRRFALSKVAVACCRFRVRVVLVASRLLLEGRQVCLDGAV
jgi:hypothetical protein